MSDILDSTFGTLLSVARRDGAELVKWGGDAILLFFDGDEHAPRAARSAFRMRRTLREVATRPTSAGAIALRMSVGVHSALHHFFLVGDPAVHRELIVSGPAASVTAEMEATAAAGQIVVSEATAALLPPRSVGAPLGTGRLLRSEPELTDLDVRPRTASRADVGRLLPLGIREYVVGGTGEAEHRPITVAFVQFSGTDEVLCAGGPQALAAALDECVRNVQHACAAHRVTFFESDINRDGGKIMLTAGAPRSAGADEDRMLRTVRQIVDNAGTLPLRVGVNRGYVFAGEFGPDFRRTYSVKGDAINLAARVMGKAAPGEVLATVATMARARTRFEAEALAPFTVKGKAKPVEAVRLGAVLGEVDTGAGEGPFVGRDDVLARLAAAVDRARTGSGALADIIGGPGIGKSRLVDELRSRTENVVVVSGRGDAYESTTAYLPVRGLLRQALATRYDTADVTDQLRLLGAGAPHLAPWLPLLGVVLDVPVEDTTETRELAEQSRKAKLEESTVAALSELLNTPSLVVFEDAHLMDEASGDLLHRIEEAVAQHPWVVLVTRRDETAGYRPAAQSAGYLRVDLDPLDAAAALDLVAALTRGSPLTRPAMRTLAGRAGGNPLFISSLAVIARRSGSLADLPESIEGVVTSEIDRLDPRDRTVLRYASVLGMRFAEADLLELLAEREYAVEGTIASRLAEFLSPADDTTDDGETTGDHGATLHFRHALVRDVAYAGLPFRLRRAMHERVGNALEARAAATADAESELLSLHFFHAGVYDKAWTYSRTAGERAFSRYAYAEAGELFERAIESARRAGGADEAAIAAAYTRLGEARAMAGAPRAAIDAYRRARRYLTDATTNAELMYKEAILWQRVGRYTQSLAMLSRGLRRLEGERGTAVATVRGKIATHYGFTRYLQGRSRAAVRWCRTGVAEAAGGADRRALAMAYNALELAYLHSEMQPDRPYGRLALEIYEALDDLPGQGHSANTLAIAAHHAGRWDEAERLFAHAAALFGRIGDITNESNAIYNRADMLLKQGRFAEAEAPLNEVIETARAVDDQELVWLAVRELARAYSGMGRHPAAADLFQEADTHFAELGLRHEQAALRAACAEAALRAGDPDGALHLVADAERMAHETGNAEIVPWLHRMRARALLDLGVLDQAATAVERGLALIGAAENGYDRALLQLVQARVAELSGADAQPLRDEATTVLRALGVDPALADTAAAVG